MKMNDYLWDRTGNDPEIEMLESQLAVFRSGVSEAPSVAKAEKKETRSRAFLSIFRLRTAFAVAMSLLIVFALSRALVTMREEIPDVSAPLASSGVPAAEIPVPPSTQPFRDAVAEPPKQALRTGKRRSAASHSRKAVRAVEPVQPPPAQTASLTNEEREAYEKLMLALSITSSKLKLVQDKADGDSAVDPGSF